MLGSLRRRFEAMGRVRDFLGAHPFADPSHAGLAERFGALLTRARGLAVEEQAGRLEARAATLHRRALRRQVESELLRYVTRVAAIAARARPELAGRFRMPARRTSGAAFLARAWDVLNLSREHQAVLAEYGLAASQVEELAEALTRFEAASERANAGRRMHVGCRAELHRAASELSELVAALDPLVKALYRGDPQTLAAWASARNVVGPFRPKGQPSAQDGPAPGGELGRAA